MNWWKAINGREFAQILPVCAMKSVVQLFQTVFLEHDSENLCHSCKLNGRGVDHIKFYLDKTNLSCETFHGLYDLNDTNTTILQNRMVIKQTTPHPLSEIC